ncbi:MAG: replicative DNA helicase, partial [Herbaspirillum sp.]
MPPHAKDLEEAVLGAVMLEAGAMDRVTEKLKTPECFYVDANARIFRTMLALSEKNSKIDMLLVVEALNRSGELEAVGGAYYVSSLTNSVVSTAHLSEHCAVVHEKYLLRQQIATAGAVLQKAYEPGADPYELIDMTESTVSQLAANGVVKSYARIGDLAVSLLNDIERKRAERERAQKDGREFIPGIDTGFPTLNAITNGWQPSDLVILAARPAVGKTALALNFALKAAEKGTPVAFFSLEMSNRQLAERVVSNKSEIYMGDLKKGRVTDDDTVMLSLTAGELEVLPLFIEDTAGMTILDFRSKVRHLVVREGVRMVFVDYLQLMGGTGRNGNREQEISNISRNMKVLAKELNIPIVALSQLSRAVELRKELEPQLSDLRESGAIEQDADVVVFAWRPDAGMTDTQIREKEQQTGQSIKGKVGLKFAKHRNGELETVSLRANLGIQKFYDPVTDHASPSANGFPDGNWRPVQLDGMD